MPPATTPSVTEPPIADPLDSIAVPDLVGLVFADAEALLRELGLEIETSGDVTADGIVTDQEPVPGDNLSEGDSVLVMVSPAWSCADGPPPVDELVSDETVQVTLLFQCGGGSEVPEISYAVIRHVPSDLEPVRAVLDQLLAGPTSDERVAGLGSFFTAETATALNSVTVDAGLAIVDFNENIYVNNASTSTGSLFFLAELNANLFQFGDIEQIEYRVDGRCEAFWNWLQRECFVVTRRRGEHGVAFWNVLGYGDATAASAFAGAAGGRSGHAGTARVPGGTL